jgi:hypothetical protein
LNENISHQAAIYAVNAPFFPNGPLGATRNPSGIFGATRAQETVVIAEVSERYEPVSEAEIRETHVSPHDFSKLTREELRTVAKSLNIVGMGRMLKPDLVAAVTAAHIAQYVTAA